MKKLESLKNNTLKSNVITENNLRNLSGGTYKTLVGLCGDVVFTDGMTAWGGGVISNDNPKVALKSVN